MLDILIIYISLGLVLSFIIDVLLWYSYKPLLNLGETIACILVWPTTLSKIINYGN